MTARPNALPLLECLRDAEHAWNCRIVKARRDADGALFFKLHWRSTAAPPGNKWGLRKICWNDSWEPEEHVADDLIRAYVSTKGTKKNGGVKKKKSAFPSPARPVVKKSKRRVVCDDDDEI